eukprot:1125690-Amphidinium_carterae.1
MMGLQSAHSIAQDFTLYRAGILRSEQNKQEGTKKSRSLMALSRRSRANTKVVYLIAWQCPEGV